MHPMLLFVANKALSLEMNSRTLDAEQTTLKVYVFSDLLYSHQYH